MVVRRWFDVIEEVNVSYISDTTNATEYRIEENITGINHTDVHS